MNEEGRREALYKEMQLKRKEAAYFEQLYKTTADPMYKKMYLASRRAYRANVRRWKKAHGSKRRPDRRLLVMLIAAVLLVIPATGPQELSGEVASGPSVYTGQETAPDTTPVKSGAKEAGFGVFAPEKEARVPYSELAWEAQAVLRSALYQYAKVNGELPDRLQALTEPIPGNFLPAIPLEIMTRSGQEAKQSGWRYSPTDRKALSNEGWMSQIEDSLKAACECVEDRPFVPLEIVIADDQNRLYLLAGDRIVRAYPVALGKRQTPTPKKTFRIGRKLMLPNPSDPPANNPFGTRAMELSDARYAIHGTNQPELIGSDVSAGCIRMFNEDAEELYAMAPLNTKVTIVNDLSSFRALPQDQLVEADLAVKERLGEKDRAAARLQARESQISPARSQAVENLDPAEVRNVPEDFYVCVECVRREEIDYLHRYYWSD